MRLKKTQKEAVLRWIAEGLLSDEINKRAAEHDPPFNVLRSQVVYYRKTRAIDIEELLKADEDKALTTGLALRSVRIQKLKKLAHLLEGDLFGDRLWLDQVKGVGSGDIAMIVDYEEFNKAEVDSLRGVYDDIAKEMGDRKTVNEHSGIDGNPLVINVKVDHADS